MDEGLWHPEASPGPSLAGKMDLDALWGTGSLRGRVFVWPQGLSLQAVYELQRQKTVVTGRSN